MENYNQMGATPGRGNFAPYPSTSSSSSMVTLLTPNNSSMHHNNNNQEMSSMGMILGSLISPARFQTCPLSVNTSVHVASNQVQERNPNNNDLGSSCNNNSSTTSNTSNEVQAMKSKIMNHPQFSNLLHSYIQCQKVGAPPEVAERLSAVWQEFENKQRSSGAPKEFPKDPELDQFMEAYNDMLVKYKVEITRPVQEAMEFMRRIESQLNVLTNGLLHVVPNDERSEGIGSSDEDQEMNSGGETEAPQNQIDPRAEDAELKKHLLKKYSGYLGSLKQELSKKKKVRKLPKEARQKLLSWWELHYKWPYPSESEKAALAEATGLDQKQINNWFINQRKRHWKPSEDMQFMVMEGLHHPHNPPALYMEGHYMGDGPYRFPT